MKTLTHPETPVEPKSELKLTDRWNTEAVRALVKRKTAQGRKPAYLFLGRREAALLRFHLGAAFGPESVQSLKNLYYMGLEVVELDTESYLRTAGLKRVQGLEEALGRRPNDRDLEASSFWRFALL